MSNNEKPVPTMDFDPVAFDAATGMFTDEEKYKYVRCLVHYWYHTHVSGLPDDDPGLRQLCQCDIGKWMRLKSMIFDNDKFFYIEGGKWHQKRARANYLKKQDDIIKRQNQTAAARDARWPDSVTEPEHKTMTTPQLILTEKALARVEKRIEVLRGQRPFSKGDNRAAELEEMKAERKRLMNILGLKA
jgi:uncharacterized protein YdaU (DUF1376 family)